MSMPKIIDVRNLVILFTMTVLMIVLYGQINYMIEPFAHWDLSSYRSMALVSPEINPDIAKPFAYRILGPYIVGLLPIPETIGFYILSIVFSICLSFQFYYLLRYIGLSTTITTVTVALFLFNKYLFGITIWNYFQVNDLLTLNFILIMFLSIWRNQWIVFGVTLVLGAITKEVSMLMIPIAFIYMLEKKELSTKWKKVVVAIIPSLIIFIFIRVHISTTGGESLLVMFYRYSQNVYSLESILRKLVNSYVPFCFIPFIFFKHTVQFFKTKKYMLWYISLVFVSTYFGSNNERLMAPTFIVFYMLIGTILQELNPKKTFLLFFIAIGFLSSFHHVFARWPLPNINWTYFFTIGTTLIITIIMYLLKKSFICNE